MVSSRHRSSIAAAAAAAAASVTSSESIPPVAPTTSTPSSTKESSSSTSRVARVPLDAWTTREKLCLASLALKHNNSWNSVARHMQAFLEKDRPENWSNQKTCAAQFNKMMNELGVDKRPKRNEPSDASGSVIYKKMTEKRIKELEESVIELRKQWLKVSVDLKALEEGEPAKDVKLEEPLAGKQKTRQPASGGKTSSKGNTSVSGESEKLPTRALTRRESSRQNLEKTFAQLYQEASEIKTIHQLCKPSPDVEKVLGSYDKIILKHVDMTTMKKNYVGDIEDPYGLMNDFLLMFQNATMYYPTDHAVYKIAVELRDRLLPQWERQIIDRYRPKA